MSIPMTTSTMTNMNMTTRMSIHTIMIIMIRSIRMSTVTTIPMNTPIHPSR